MKAQRIQLVGVSGSLRSSSYSTGILHALAERVREVVDLVVITLDEIPLYTRTWIPTLPCHPWRR